MKSLVVAVLVAASGAIDQAPLQESTVSSSHAVQLFDVGFQEFVEQTMIRWHVPGFSIAFSNDSATIAQGFGHAVFPDTKATPDTLYYTGSTTKSFTVASTLQLIEDGAKSDDPISLQTRISSLIRDEFVLQDTYTTEHATLEDAMSHRTGMARHEGSYGGPNFTAKTIVQHLRYLPMTAELRAEYQYCNMMFDVLAYIVEVLTGSWIGDYMHKNVWKPLGMTSTFLHIVDAERAESQGQVSLSRGYYYNESSKAYVPQEYLFAPESAGAGSMTMSTVLDYTKYLRAMLHKDPAILSAESYAELRQSRSIVNGAGEAPYTGPLTYGLGWEIATYRGLELFYHGGSTIGYGALMLYVPAKNWTMALMGNTDLYANIICDIVMYEYLDNLLEVPREDRFSFDKKWSAMIDQMDNKWDNARKDLYPHAPSPRKSLQPSLHLSAYTGTYHHPGYQNLTLKVQTSPSWWLRDEEQVLHADVLDHTWKITIDFEHVNGDYFIARPWPLQSSPTKVFEKTQLMKAEFRIGEDGKPKQLGIDAEPAMKGEKIWYEKIE